MRFDRLDPQILRERRLVLPSLADHRPGLRGLEEELDYFSAWAGDGAVGEHVG